MPPLTARRSLSSALPTLLSLSKLLHVVPSFASRRHVKRGAEWSTCALAALTDSPIEPEDPPDSPVFWWKLGLSIVLVLSGGVFAGLTLALMGSDDLNLRVLSTSSDDPKERKNAAKVLRLLSRGRHWVLVVLLLGNVIVNESLPIFLDDVLGGGVAAVIVSTTMIVIFGEIIPQAVCVRFGTAIGGACAPLVFCLMILFSPIAYPIAKILDRVLGQDEGHTYKKAELKSFLQFHREGEEPLRDDEIGILNGVLSLNDRHAKQIMTPIGDCLILPTNMILDHDAIDQILLSGFSRIPIHEPEQKDNFVGMLLVKRLITYNPDEELTVAKFPLLPLPEARPDINCFQALDYFQTGRAHLLLISDTPGKKGGALGIVSLEDLIEEIIGEEIVDETDRFTDNRSHKAAKRSGTAAVMRGIIERRRVVNASSRNPSISGPATQASVQLAHPSDPNDGPLIQIDNGAQNAEAVPAPKSDKEQNAAEGKPPVVGDIGADVERMERIEENGGDGTGQGKEDGEASKEIGGQPGETKDGKKDDTDLLGDEGEVCERGALPFPTHDSFERTCGVFLDKYGSTRSSDSIIGPGRTNRGWSWREHRTTRHYGYLYRRTTRHVPTTYSNGDENPIDGDDEQLEDSEELNSLLPAGQGDRPSRIEVEHNIVYSRTYHVPMLCLRAWDETGAPLPLSRLLSAGVICRGAYPAGNRDREDALLLDANTLFPLLQQTEHPSTGEIMWSVHPCQVSVAVDEVLAADMGSRDTRQEGVGLRWLEAWMMRSGEIVDLAYP